MRLDISVEVVEKFKKIQMIITIHNIDQNGLKFGV